MNLLVEFIENPYNSLRKVAKSQNGGKKDISPKRYKKINSTSFLTGKIQIKITMRYVALDSFLR